MEITATLERGSFTFEMEGDSRKEIQEEILSLAEFVQENEDALNVFAENIHKVERGNKEKAVQTPATDWQESDSTYNTNASEFTSISQRIKVEEEVLAQLFEIPDNDDEPPFLSLYQFEEESEVLGGHRNQRQAKGSVLLLYLWKECRGIEGVKLEELDEALSYSNIEIERRDAMYQALSGDARKWFDSNDGKIQLTTPGEHRARQIISELADEFQSQ